MPGITGSRRQRPSAPPLRGTSGTRAGRGCRRRTGRCSARPGSHLRRTAIVGMQCRCRCRTRRGIPASAAKIPRIDAPAIRPEHQSTPSRLVLGVGLALVDACPSELAHEAAEEHRHRRARSAGRRRPRTSASGTPMSSMNTAIAAPIRIRSHGSLCVSRPSITTDISFACGAWSRPRADAVLAQDSAPRSSRGSTR